MNVRNGMRPVHPGEVLREEIDALDISANTLAQELDVPFLGELPITIGLREHGDAGNMMAVFEGTDAGPLFDEMCRELVARLADANAANPPMPSLPVL